MRNHSTLVSCITIFFNQEKFICDSIESVLKQTHTNWELLLIDDGSSDKSSEIAKTYSALYPSRIFYYEHEDHKNLGMSASRNLGILKSKGELISFLDADDVWLPDKLEDQIQLLKENPEAGMVYGRSLLWYNWPGNEITETRDHFLELGVTPNSIINPPKLFFIHLKNKYQSPTTCSVLIRREVFDNVGFFENMFTGLFEDQVFFAKLCLKYPVFVSDECWSKYRQHTSSCSFRTQSENYYHTRNPYLKWLDSYLRSNGFQNYNSVWGPFRRHTIMHKFKYFFSSLKGKLKKRIVDLAGA